MPQTLLSIAGLLIVTFLSFNQQQASIRTQQEAVRAELRQMAIGVAKQSMEVVRARAFDNATISMLCLATPMAICCISARIAFC